MGDADILNKDNGINRSACRQYRGPFWMSQLDYCSGRRLREAA